MGLKEAVIESLSLRPRLKKIFMVMVRNLLASKEDFFEGVFELQDLLRSNSKFKESADKIKYLIENAIPNSNVNIVNIVLPYAVFAESINQIDIEDYDTSSEVIMEVLLDNTIAVIALDELVETSTDQADFVQHAMNIAGIEDGEEELLEIQRAMYREQEILNETQLGFDMDTCDKLFEIYSTTCGFSLIVKQYENTLGIQEVNKLNDDELKTINDLFRILSDLISLGKDLEKDKITDIISNVIIQRYIATYEKLEKTINVFENEFHEKLDNLKRLDKPGALFAVKFFESYRKAYFASEEDDSFITNAGKIIRNKLFPVNESVIRRANKVIWAKSL